MPRSEHIQPLDGITLCTECGYSKERSTGQGGARHFCCLHGHKVRLDDVACEFFTVEVVEW